MATFSYNQVSQFYVGNEYVCPVPDDAKPGTVGIKHTPEYFYLDYMGAAGPLRSDLVDKDKVLWATIATPEMLAHKLKRVKFTINPNCSPKECSEINLKVLFRQVNSLGEADTKVKHGVHWTGMNVDDGEVIRSLAHSLVHSFSALEDTLITVYLDDSATADSAGTLTEVKWGTKLESLPKTAKGIVIEEAPQAWKRGVKAMHPVVFDVFPSVPETVCSCQWGVVNTLPSANVIGDGRKVADMEWFFMGARADQLRGSCGHNGVDTEYLVDPSQEYHVLTIHYYYQGDNEAVQRSEKDMIIVFKDKAVATQFVADFNTATGNKFNLVIP